MWSCSFETFSHPYAWNLKHLRMRNSSLLFDIHTIDKYIDTVLLGNLYIKDAPW